MPDATETFGPLNELLAGLSAMQEATAKAAPAASLPAVDAIGQELARKPRTTAVVSLNDAPEVVEYRNEWVNGMIRADTANKLISLVNTIVTGYLVAKG